MKLLIVLSALLLQDGAASTQATGAALAWRDRQVEIEEFLKTGPIERFEDVPIGKSRPRRVFFAEGGAVHSAIAKDIPPREVAGQFDSYRSEIAAYELDKLLDLDMIPPTVRRRLRGKSYSLQLWIRDARSLDDIKGQSPPRPLAWLAQLYRQRVFDALIANTDRNVGNIVVDPDWNMVLVDHSRSFSDTLKIPHLDRLERIDRLFFDRLKALEYQTIQTTLGHWLRDPRCASAFMARRNRIVKHFEKLAAKKGDLAVFSQ